MTMAEERHELIILAFDALQHLPDAGHQRDKRLSSFAIQVVRVAALPVSVDQRLATVTGRVMAARKREIGILMHWPLLQPHLRKALDRRLGTLLGAQVR